MADNITLDPGSGGSTVATDEDGSNAHHQYVKVEYGPDNTQTKVTATNGLPVQDDGGSLTVDHTNIDNLHSADFDTGGGTDTTPAIGIAVPASGGAAVIPGDATAGLKVDLGNDNDVIVTGTVTVDATGQGDIPVTLAGETVVLGVGAASIGTLGANSGVDIGDVDILSLPGVAAEGAALGEGVLLQGDDGTDRKNINVDPTTGDLQVDVTNTVTVDGSGVTQPIPVASLPLPTGAATATNQATGNGSLSTIAGTVSGSEMQVDLVASLPAGTNNIGDVDVATIAAGANLVGDVGLSGARTSGGTTLYKNIDVDETEDQVKGTAGQIYWIHAINLSAAVKYLKLYNATTASVTVGTTVPDLTFPIPTQGDTNGAGFVLSIPNGIAFDTAVTIAATTGVADNDSGAPGANEVIVNLGFA